MTAFFPDVTHVEKSDFCISACLMSTKIVQYYPHSTRNIGLYETSCWMQYSASPGLFSAQPSSFKLLLRIKKILAHEKKDVNRTFNRQPCQFRASVFYILNCCYSMFLASCIDIVCMCPYIRIVIFSNTFSKSRIVCTMNSGYC